MLRTEKEHIVAELVERLRTAETLIIADYRGLTHAELDEVRTELLKHGARFTIVKNRLTKRAADTAGIDALDDFLTGPTAIAFVHDGDMVAVARTLHETARATKRLELKGGVLAGKRIDAGAVENLATLPPLDVLRGQVLGAVVAPVTALVGLVAAPLQNLAGLIDGRINQLEAGADAEEPAPEEEPATPTEADTQAPEEPATTAEADAQDGTHDDSPEPVEPAQEGEE